MSNTTTMVFSYEELSNLDSALNDYVDRVESDGDFYLDEDDRDHNEYAAWKLKLIAAEALRDRVRGLVWA